MIEKIDDQRKRIEKKDKDKARKKVIIIGAGMAGLTAAYELALLQHEVIIYEASNRSGGRAWTHHFEDGQFHEFGAMRFPITHDYTRFYAKICKLEFRKFVNHHGDGDAFYYFKGILCKHSQWKEKLLPFLNLTDKEKLIIDNGPEEQQLLNLLFYPLSQLIVEIESSPVDKKALLGYPGINSKRIEELDKISLGDYLSQCLESNDAIDLIGTITALEALWDRAVTFFLREEIIARERLKIQEIDDEHNIIEEFENGTDALPRKLLDKILKMGVKVNFQHEIVSIKNREENVQLGLKVKDSLEVIDCDYVICTVPFSVLRRLQLSGLSEGKMRAIRNMDYTSSIKVLINTKERFWEKNEKIYGGASQSELINRQIIYPSDNVKSDSIKSSTLFKSVIGQVEYSLSKTSKDTSISDGPGVLVGTYCWGQDARRIGALNYEERFKLIVNTISAVHPEIVKDGVSKACASMFWDENKFTAGAFSFMKPGDFTNYYSDTIKAEGNLFFAGEHCSLDNGWIQGSIISSLNAVESIVNQ
jgi:monoamine oxidase